MCGICGVVSFTAPVDEAVVTQMMACLRHRGPDASGVWMGGPAGLGHTRLSIIDLSPTGAQPMTDPEGRFVIVYNGEVYNFGSLRDELRGEGVQFRGRSDTEVVLAAYRRWGTGAFSRLHGMFALAIWDTVEERLVLARDRLGIKPLYYELGSKGLAFGSEAKAILRYDGRRRGLDWAALNEFLWYGNALGPGTLFDGIRKLGPGQLLVYDEKGARIEQYWSLTDIPARAATADTAAQQVRQLLSDAVRSHLVADVPVGVFLSGGVDSTALTAFASKHYSGQLETYSVGFDDLSIANELPQARKVAALYGTTHHEVRVAGAASADAIVRLVRAHDEPFGDAANIPLFLLCEQLRGTVKVVLQGDGGDELFGGYRHFAMVAHLRRWALGSRAAAAIARWLPGWAAQRVVRLAAALNAPTDWERIALLLTRETAADPPTRLLSEQARESLRPTNPFARYRELAEQWRGVDKVQQMLFADLAVLLPQTFLEKVDRATMAHGVEVRVPFLDADLVDAVVGLPSEVKLPGGRQKALLKAALRNVVPDWVLDAPKTGFGVPTDQWLRGPLNSFAKAVFADPVVRSSGLFDGPALDQCYREHEDRTKNWGFTLWKYLQLSLWYREYCHAD